MVAKVHTVSFHGVEAQSVIVEVHLHPGLVSFNIVGLADKSVIEARERIRACFHAIGLALPPKKITINLAPADRQKEGAHYDLPIALGLLIAMNIVSQDEADRYIVLGEISLDGKISSVVGVLPTALLASEQELGIICPTSNRNEACWAGDIPILAPENIIDLVNHFKGKSVLLHPEPQLFASENEDNVHDFHDVKGQATARRALEIAAAGGHNLLMIGPPGSGKSMLAKRLPGILPSLSPKEALETTMIYSVAGLLDKRGIVMKRPFREPHHTSSLVALVGGGRKAKPGEISLAHNGVLFMDELPEFSGVAIESLRQPIESGDITVARAENHINYPAKFQLIGAMNPCKCGYFGELKKQCYRAPNCARDYQNKLSGPITDRFDLFIYMSKVKITDLSKVEEGTEVIKQRVRQARERQIVRWQEITGKDDLDFGHTNALLDGEILRKHVNLSAEANNFLNEIAEKLDISARRYNRTLRVARTIADLANHTAIEEEDLLEALSYRLREFN